MKLELKHLAPYLPYGLNVKMQHINGKIRKIIFRDSSEIHIEVDSGVVLCLADILDIKPILRPLSDLRKEFYFEGTEDIPIEYLTDKYPMHNIEATFAQILDDNEDWIYHLDYFLMQHLFEWHMDVFGLIDEGLAIDINTL